MNSLRLTNILLILMCVFSCFTLFILFTSTLTEERVAEIAGEVTVSILEDY